jgi:2-keto-3-deoxy-L-rhamnonate aldolase RhmA
MSPDQRDPAASLQRVASLEGRGGPQRADRASSGQGFELLLFATDTALVEEATRAGMDGFIIDWEWRGKHRRQAGEGTQINHDTLSDLRRVRGTTDATVICRLNGFGAWTPREVDRAIDAGADELLLPMVRGTDEVDRTLEMVGGRCGLGILVETRQGVRATPELVTRPLSRVYVGLNDLRIDRGSSELFEPLVDGTVEHVRSHVGRMRFGVAGLTLPDRGSPVPSRLLAAELTRLGADFTFLRRSFLADTGGRQLTPAVRAIRADLMRLAARTPAQELADRQALLGLVSRSAVLPA